MTQCKATTLAGNPCTKPVMKGYDVCSAHDAPGSDRKKAKPRPKGARQNPATKRDEALQQRMASFNAMTPDEKFQAFEARGYTIERQRIELARLTAELQRYTLRNAKALSDGHCIVCGDVSPLEPLCSDVCAALHGRSAADWRP